MNLMSRAEGFALCHTCALRHPCFEKQGYLDFLERHRGHSTSYLNRDHLAQRGHHRLAAWDPRKILRSFFGLDALAFRIAIEGYAPNADVKQALQAMQTLTVTNLHSLASSPTAGWQSAEIDNTTNLYLDALVQVVLDFAVTAPANSKAAYVLAAAGIETAKLSNPFSGAEGTLTLTDVTTTEQNAAFIGRVKYTTADEVAEGGPMSVAAGYNGVLPPFWAVGIMNHSGSALAASGNSVKHRGVFSTVV